MIVRKGYYVFREGIIGQKPKKRHDTPDEALLEAERLARSQPCAKFLVLEVLGGVHFTEEFGLRVVDATDPDEEVAA